MNYPAAFHKSEFSHIGLQRVGCYFVSRFSRRIGLLEGQTLDLSDDPRTRQDPIRKCGTGAQDLNYQLFAVSVGYCISGSNRRSDYTSTESNLCSNGVGALINGNFLMNVYEIQDPDAFRASVAEITATTVPTAAPPVPTDSAGGNLIIGSNGATTVNSSSALLLFLVFITVLNILVH